MTRRGSIVKQSGFTLIELIVALAVFTLMMSIVMVGYLGVVRSHAAGVVQRSTQQNTRLALDQAVKNIQRSSQVNITPGSLTPPTYDVLCLERGGQHIALKTAPYTVGTFNLNSLVLETFKTSDCAPANKLTTTRLTDDNVTVTQFKSVKIPSSDMNDPTLVGITLSIASVFGQDFIDTANYTQCRTAAGSHFCSITTMRATAAMKGAIEE